MPFDAHAVLVRLNNHTHVATCYYGKTDFYEPCTCPPGQGNPTYNELEMWLRTAVTFLLNKDQS